MGVNKVIFACVHNAGRSQMAAGFFNHIADGAKAMALSAGTRPGREVHPEVVAAMRETGIDLSSARPQLLTSDVARDVTMLVTMGCGEECPYVPGIEREDWALADPNGRPIEEVRAIRDEIRRRVVALVQSRGGGRSKPVVNRSRTTWQRGAGIGSRDSRGWLGAKVLDTYFDSCRIIDIPDPYAK